MRLTAFVAMASQVIKLPRDYRFGTSRPSTIAAKKKNPPGKRRSKIFVEPITKDEWQYFRGDTVGNFIHNVFAGDAVKMPAVGIPEVGMPTLEFRELPESRQGQETDAGILAVEVLSGKDAGKQGKVTQVVRERNWVVVENLNTHYRYVGKSADYMGQYVASEAPLLINNVALVDPTDRKPTEVEWRYTEEGERVRVSVRTGRIINKPVFQRLDGIVPEQWKDCPKDTSVEDALEMTYVPSLKLFQEEIMEKMGIVEDRRHRKSFWY